MCAPPRPPFDRFPPDQGPPHTLPLSPSNSKSEAWSVPRPTNNGWPAQSSLASTHSQVSIRTLSWLFTIQRSSSHRRRHAVAAATVFATSRELWFTPNVPIPNGFGSPINNDGNGPNFNSRTSFASGMRRRSSPHRGPMSGRGRLPPLWVAHAH